MLDELNHLGIEFVSFRENLDTGGPLGRAVVIIIGAIAELEQPHRRARPRRHATGTAGRPAQNNLGQLEDPVIWFSGGWYHVLVNNWGDRRAYHLISRDGITHWLDQGVAYYPQADFIRYTNGQVNHWNKLERPGVFLENGHVTAITLAVIDVPKEEEIGNNNHGSKIVVIPFDGVALDRDLAHAEQAR